MAVASALGLRAGVGAISLALAGCGASTSTASPVSSSAATPSASAPFYDARLEVVASGLVAPIGLIVAPGEMDRSFVLDQTGKILILKGGAIQPTPFLNISNRLVSLNPDYDERGLLGLAFHPKFASNGRFFVYYGAPVRAGAPGAVPHDHTDTLSEFRVSQTDPDRADPASERKLLEFEQPQPNHSGGALGFGPDGFLYLGAGDGGGTGDASDGHSPQGNAQDLQKLNGKLLRIDVDGTQPYAIPADNPFAGRAGRPEIYAYGLRNPWRLSWEPAGERRLLVSDVGYGRYEEVDVVERGGNYGWRIREGRHCLDVKQPLAEVSGCPTSGANGDSLADPVIEYTHAAVGLAVVGGYVYRGSALPALRGRYVFADWSADWTTTNPTPRGSLLVSQPKPGNDGDWGWRFLILPERLNLFVTGLGEDASGEVYVLGRSEMGPTGRTGQILELLPT